MKFKLKRQIISVILVLFIVGTFLFINFTKSQVIEDNEELEPNTDLIYYINVTYDGKDKNGVYSSDNRLANIYSKTIYVEDILPSDLTFQHFLSTEEGSIGAVERDSGRGCLGQVIDDSRTLPSAGTFINENGLHYDTATRKVSFHVRGLQAGCQLTVGVVTKTPETVDDKSTSSVEVRRDIYNTALAKDKNQVVTSNTTHSWMGLEEEFVQFYKVKYVYDKEYPDAPSVPDERRYTALSTVSLATESVMDGYIFTGWHAEDITVINGTFKMPEREVVLVGGFERIKDYTVTYRIEGDMPDGYEPPNLKTYYVGNIVDVDSTSTDFTYKGFQFKGWSTNDVAVLDNRFEMPDHNVVITGRFEKIKHTLSYQFTSEMKPSDSSRYLPASREYAVGDKVTLAHVSDAPGYTFIGWLSDSEFIMPDHDVVISGEWKKEAGTFTPSINIIDSANKEYYRPGERINYNIVVTNKESYPIKDVQVKQNNDLQFISGNNYTIRNDKIVVIPSIGSNSSVTIKASYVVGKDLDGTRVQEVEIISALSDNDYLFHPNGSIKASASIRLMSTLTICNEVNKGTGHENFSYSIKGVNYESWLSLNNSCKTIYVHPGSYSVHEVIPQEYTLKDVFVTKGGSTTKLNGDTIIIDENGNTKVTFSNTYKKHGFFHSVKWLYSKIRGRE